MKPIAVFRHAPTEGPGYLGNFLTQHGLTWQLIAIDAGDAVPGNPHAYAGLVFMGGPMSVNDDLPWIPAVLSLIRAAVAAEVPVLGHCLGGQLIAKALGGVVTRNPIKEIGWGAAEVLDNDTARAWFGDTHQFEAFHWHGETFSLPPGATPLLKSAHCANQAYALGPHLGLQCHVEMTADMIQNWCDVGLDEIERALSGATPSPAVQTPAQMQALNTRNLPALHRVASALYARWIDGLRP